MNFYDFTTLLKITISQHSQIILFKLPFVLEPRNPSESEFFVTFNNMLDFCGERLTACLTLKLEDGLLSADDYAASVYVHHAL
jgi:hypothetical protein